MTKGGYWVSSLEVWKKTLIQLDLPIYLFVLEDILISSVKIKLNKKVNTAMHSVPDNTFLSGNHILL